MTDRTDRRRAHAGGWQHWGPPARSV